MSNNIFGEAGESRKFRGFSEKEFKEELIPEYVKCYYKYKNKETREVVCYYVDSPNEEDSDETNIGKNIGFEIEKIILNKKKSI